MTSLAIFLAPLALLAPALSGGLLAPAPGAPSVVARQVAQAAPEQVSPALGLRADPGEGALRVLEDAHRPPTQNQVHIEHRVIIRIAPSPPAQRERLLAALPRRPIGTAYAEVEHGDCVAVEQIAGVQPADGRLLLFLRDRRVLSAALESACSPRDFYQGFYVERSEDGQLCIARDRLESRAGASCQVDELHRLVAVRD